MSPPDDTAMTTNDSNQLLELLLQRLEDMSTRMERLEAPSHQPPKAPSHNTDATGLTPTPTPTPTPEPSNTTAPLTLKPRHSLPHQPTFSGNKSQCRGWKLEMEGKIEEDAQALKRSYAISTCALMGQQKSTLQHISRIVVMDNEGLS
jgi:hypothetical protein